MPSRHQTVDDIMCDLLVTVAPDDTLIHAATLMAEHDVGALPVVRDEMPIGIITDRDIVIRCLARGLANDDTALANRSVEQIMTKGLLCISKSDTIREAAERMEAKRVRRLGVCDDEGRLIGIVSVGDLAAIGHKRNLTGEVLEKICEHAGA